MTLLANVFGSLVIQGLGLNLAAVNVPSSTFLGVNYCIWQRFTDVLPVLARLKPESLPKFRSTPSHFTFLLITISYFAVSASCFTVAVFSCTAILSPVVNPLRSRLLHIFNSHIC